MSSFRRASAASSAHAKKQPPLLPFGTKLSALTQQPITSTGISSLDDILGGGVPLGTMLCVIQDEYTAYHRILVKYAIAQGLSMGKQQKTVVVGDDLDSLIQHLPGWNHHQINTQRDQNRQEDDEAKLKIAWRYQHLPNLNTPPSLSSPSHRSSIFIFV